MRFKMKKKLVQINTVCNGSVGRIMGQIQRTAMEQGMDTLSIYGRRKGYGDMPCVKCGNGVAFWLHVALTTVTDRHGFGSYFVTKKMVGILRREQPDVIHLHNIHGYYLHIGVLFRYLKEEYKGKVIWSLHDCWAFTGHCPYYIMAQCDQWKENCYKCSNQRSYPISFGLDRSKKNYRDKKELFTGIKDLTLLVPSQWLKEQVAESYLCEYPCRVIAHGINRKIFHPVDNQYLRDSYGIAPNSKIILGVASIWEERKGLRTFVELAQSLSQQYQIVLVGVSSIQKQQLSSHGIIGILRTEHMAELVELYTAAYMFVNPSREETFSLVTLEALACGTPVIVTNDSATKELVGACGVIVQGNEVTDYLAAIHDLEEQYPSQDTMSKHVECYELEQQMNEVMKLYES